MGRIYIVAVPDEVEQAQEINGHPVLYCGVGKINAAAGAMEAIRRGATELVNIGSCGSRRHTLGEIIKIGRVHQDIDCSPICAYGHTAFEDNSDSIELDPASPYSCFTTDYFYDHLQLPKYSPHYLEQIERCSVFDMELYAMAKICRRYQIPLTSYKWVSDDGDFSKWQENCRLSFHHVLELLK